MNPHHHMQPTFSNADHQGLSTDSMPAATAPHRTQGGRSSAFAVAMALLSCLIAGPASAQWSVGQLDDLANAFTTGVSSAYDVTPYPWRFMADCNAADCYSNNPDSTYGMPNFGMRPGQVVSARTLAPTGALVLVMETPPPMRYFGVTPYIYSKYYPKLPLKPSASGTVTVFESLTDTTNVDVVGTTGSPTPGSNVFTQLAAFVVTADARTHDDIAGQLVSLGFPGYAINRLDLPLAVAPPVPLNMGTDPHSDTYAVLLRLTYPSDGARLDDYVQRAPIRSFYLSPKLPRAVDPVPPTTYKRPGSGQAEPSVLRTAQGQLVNQLLTHFGGMYGAITESQVAVGQTRNYAHVARGTPGNGDNPDAIYTADVGVRGTLAPAPDDRILVVGVNHNESSDGTGKATYFSHSLEIVKNSAGVLAVPDTWLARTALVAAGVGGPDDPRYATYRRLYAFTMSYNCPADDTLCVTIPQPSDSGGGVPLGTPVQLVGRIYLDPATRTRPSSAELILERVFVMSNATTASR